MNSLDDDFRTLLQRLESGRRINDTGQESVYYLVFDPKMIIEVKRRKASLVGQLSNNGWDVVEFSFAQAVADILGNHPARRFWQEAAAKQPLNWTITTGSLANALQKRTIEGTEVNPLGQALEMALEKAATKPRGLLLVTDLEALHPYLRVGTLEGQLTGKFTVPTVFLYPGTRSGETLLRFLGFYPEDGNYRSAHIGG